MDTYINLSPFLSFHLRPRETDFKCCRAYKTLYSNRCSGISFKKLFYHINFLDEVAISHKSNLTITIHIGADLVSYSYLTFFISFIVFSFHQLISPVIRIAIV